MLVLSRKRGEQLLIGDDIVVTVVECNGSRIKIGIEAPNDVRIVRGELTSQFAGRASFHGLDTDEGFSLELVRNAR